MTNENETFRPTPEIIKELLPDKTWLFHLDRSDEYESYEAIQEAMQKGCYSPIDEDIDSWLWEHTSENVDYYTNEFRSDIMRKYDLTEEEGDVILFDYEDLIRDTIYNNDLSNPVKELIGTVRNLACFYDTGYEVPCDSWRWTKKEMNQEIRAVKKHLGIKGKDHDAEIHEMLCQASYGGTLVVYFNPDINDIVTSEGNMIRFTKPQLAVIDIYNGSGGTCEPIDHDIVLPLERSNFFVDKTIKYSYTHEVCGMDSTWCRSTGVEIYEKKTKKTTPKSEMSTLINRDKKYAEVYKKGGCSAGDMDIARHRKTTYINNFPCGTKCLDCGTFWID
jgi:hypothetical protein